MEEQTTNTGLKQHLSPWLKWIMVVVGIAVVASLAYFYGFSEGVDSADKTTETAETKTTVADWQKYENEDYNFELALSEQWRGYRVKTTNDAEKAGVVHVKFYLPCTENEECIDNPTDNSANAMTISVYTAAAWAEKMAITEGPAQVSNENVLGTNDGSTYYLTQWQDPPESLADVDLGISSIKSSFKFTN